MSDNTLFCTQCGAQSTGSATFCQKCGARLASPSPTTSAVSGASFAAVPGYTAAHMLPQRYAGFWIRLAAYVLDRIILGVVAVPLILIFCLPIIMSIVRNDGQAPPPRLFAVLVLAPALLALVWLYEALLTSSPWQGTVGKRILRLKVTDDFGNKITFRRSTGRFFAKILSGMVMYIGFIMVAFMDRKRGLHDVICSTQVLRY